jgi:hypothetical protein
MVWLHGTLYINILEARNLANDSNISLVPRKLPGRLGSGDATKLGRMFAKAANATENAIGEAALVQAHNLALVPAFQSLCQARIMRPIHPSCSCLSWRCLGSIP